MFHSKKVFYLIVPILILSSLLSCTRGSRYTFSNDSKPASRYTLDAHKAVTQELNFDDDRDFKDSQKGFIAKLEGPIKSKDGMKEIFDPAKFPSLTQGKPPETVNPSLWRQSQLTSINGLFRVSDHIYQVRGIDLANVSFIRGKKGWIIIDPLMTTETAKTALDLVRKNVENLPVTAIIFTHSHIDHFGGVYGMASKRELESGKIQVIAPKDFVYESVSENVIAGTAMSRRAEYMYARTLDFGPQGSVGTGLGSYTPSGEYAIARPTTTIDKDRSLLVDGVTIDFMFTPGAEAPTEMMAYFPRDNALCGAEILSHTMHNVQTLRGAQVRDSLMWSKHIQRALEKYSKADILFGSHHWPTFGNDRVVSHMASQRDLYKFIHDQSVNRLNKGLSGTELADSIELNKNLARNFANRGYYGSLSHNTRAVYDKYLGFFDGNPAHLNPLPDVESAKKTIAYMGGAGDVLEMAIKDYKAGEYRFVAEVLNKLVFAQPKNVKAKQLLADAYEQLAYQSENATWRNFYVQGAQELRYGVGMPAPPTASPAILSQMDSELLLDYLSVRVNSEKANGADLTLELNITDRNEKYYLTLRNSVLNYSMKKPQEQNRQLASDDNASISLKHGQFVKLAMGAVSFAELDEKNINYSGDKKVFDDLNETLDTFPNTFNIVTP
ncbi:alkyl sulfatase dimerization domain-containing protein [Halobacteriovorax sp. HFRX-2_2]|uniref:alkyl/aryl-sulfatase n=1 Tax=unclassified Halobacteriovorax TaxID=2639665 RepID=UPI00371ACD4E